MLVGLSMSLFHCEVFLTPIAASPTACRMPWSKENAGPTSGMSTPACAYCLRNAIPMPPGRKKYTLSAPEARIWAISAA